MNKPVEIATLTGAEAVIEMLQAHGVEVIFGLCPAAPADRLLLPWSLRAVPSRARR